VIHPQHKCIPLNSSISSCILQWANSGQCKGREVDKFYDQWGKQRQYTINYVSNTVYLPKMWSTYSGMFMASHRVGDSEAMYQEILATHKW